MYCGERSIVKYEREKHTAVSLRCKAWTCPDCEPRRRAELIKDAIRGAPTRFLTLTSRRTADRTAEQAANELSHAWRLIRLRLMRYYKLKRLAFLAVFDKTKLGWPHLHILVRGPWLDQALISRWMAELTDSPIVDLRAIDGTGRVAVYVAKYCGKDSHRFGTSKRYWKSQDYDEPNPKAPKFKCPPGQGWDQDRRSLEGIVASWIELGWRVERLSVREAVAWLPP